MKKINLKKEILTRNYTAKQKLPGGIVKDDVIVHNLQLNTFTLKKTGQIVPYDCVKEKDFFKEEEIPKFQHGETVCILKDLTFSSTSDSKRTKLGNNVHVKASTELKVISCSGITCTVELMEQPGVKCIIRESLLFPWEYWFFYNSDGQLQKVLVGRFPKKEAWMKMIDQYFTSASEAETWKINKNNI